MTVDSVHITIADTDDATAIANLSRNEVEYGLPWTWTPIRVARCVRHDRFNVVVAKDADFLAGFGIMEYEDSGATLSLLAVNPAYRRHSIGTRIVDWLEQVAINAGIFDIVVQLRECNSDAEAFYRHLAFEPMTRVKRYYRDGESALVMTKQLAKTVNPTMTPWQPRQ